MKYTKKWSKIKKQIACKKKWEAMSEWDKDDYRWKINNIKEKNREFYIEIVLLCILFGLIGVAIFKEIFK